MNKGRMWWKRETMSRSNGKKQENRQTKRRINLLIKDMTSKKG